MAYGPNGGDGGGDKIVSGGGRRGGWRCGRAGSLVGDEDEGLLVSFWATVICTRVTLNHALGSKEVLDLLAEDGDIVVFLEPFGPLRAKAQTLQP